MEIQQTISLLQDIGFQPALSPDMQTSFELPCGPVCASPPGYRKITCTLDIVDGKVASFFTRLPLPCGARRIMAQEFPRAEAILVAYKLAVQDMQRREDLWFTIIREQLPKMAAHLPDKRRLDIHDIAPWRGDTVANVLIAGSLVAVYGTVGGLTFTYALCVAGGCTPSVPSPGILAASMNDIQEMYLKAAGPWPWTALP